jgi:alpha-2-macroglobulin
MSRSPALLRLLALLTALFGEVSWRPPAWLGAVAKRLGDFHQYCLAHPRELRLAVLGVLLTVLAGLWWQSQPVPPAPPSIACSVQPPVLTDYRAEGGKKVAPLQLQCGESTAPIQSVGKALAFPALKLQPELAGSWRWASDRVLEFQPADDWPVATDYTLTLQEEGLFAPGIRVTSYQHSFTTAPFTATLTGAELYQDPLDPGLKRMVSTLRFSHPVDPASLEGLISHELGDGLRYREPGKPGHALSIDEDGIEAHIHSAALAIPLEPVGITLKLRPGIRALRGGPAVDQPLQQSVTVPGRYQLVVEPATLSHVTSATGESEQVLLFGTSYAVTDEAISDKVRAWQLPPSETWTHGEVTEALLAASTPITLSHIPSVEPQNTQHAFRIKAPVNALLYVAVAPGVEAIPGYVSKDPTVTTLTVPNYPQSLKLMGQGVLLSLSGERKLGFMAQGIPGVRIDIARLLPRQLHHLVDQNYGSMARPEVYGDNFDRLIERRRYEIPLTGADPSRPLYDHIDLSDYLDAEDGRRGVFVLQLSQYDPAQPEINYASDYVDDSSPGDRRFILVTDLGVIAKRALDGSEHVYVQSLHDGLPEAGVTVEVLGRNGLPVQTGETDAEGHVQLPGLNNLGREQTPIMLLVRKDGDLSFLPLGRDEHRLELSRFDIGGDSTPLDPGTLSAFAFTDRGLYRPGETAHIGWVLRTEDWQGVLEGVPIEVQVSDARGALLASERRRLSRSGLDSLDVATSATGPSGSYDVSIYLINELDQVDRWLGGTSFKVREFEPDRMKVHLSLAGQQTPGWLRPADIHARVNALHLFGAAASDRRVGGEMRLSPALPAFDRYPDHRFHVEGALSNAVSENLSDTTTDAEGNAELELDLGRFDARSYRLDVTARVFEAGAGRQVIAESGALVSDRPYLVGVKVADALDYVRQGESRSTSWLAVGPDLEAQSVAGLALTRLEHRHVSVLVKQANGTFKYESRRKSSVRETVPFELDAAGSALSLPTDEPGDFSYVLKDAGGVELNRVDWTVAGVGNLTRSLERNAELQLKLDRKTYAPGDNIEVAIRAPYTGAGLITIERDRVYTHRWFKTDTTSSVQTITLPEGIEGNAYVSVQFVRDPASPEVYTSPLSYGVVPFSISLAARELTIEVSTPATQLPGSRLPLHVTASAATDAIIYAVDEGILQVAGYRTPRPLDYFFRKRALQVDTLQILRLLLPEFSKLMSAAAPGGDAEAALASNLNPFARKRRGPVAWWSGVVHVPAEGLDLEYTVPDSFNGRLRIMAVAVAPERIGVHEGKVEVRGPWVLTPNVPALVTPGDRFSVTVGAFSNLEQPESVSVALETSAGLEVLSPSPAVLEVDPAREGTAVFELRATETLGPADLVAVATSPGIDVPVRLAESISVRPAQPYRVELSTGLTREPTLKLPLLRTLYPELRKVLIGAADTPLVWAAGLSDYLADYSYSCTEQLISKAMPALVWSSVDGRLGTTPEAVLQAFRTLRERQNDQGGFGLWAANPIVESRVSLHAIDFLAEAEARGATVPAGLANAARSYLESLVNQPAEGMEQLRDHAQAAYLLTRQGVLTTSTLANLVTQLETYHPSYWRNNLAAAYIAASHQLLQQTAEAGKLLARVPWHGLGKVELDAYGIYYDSVIHDAELLALTARHFPERLGAVPDGVLVALGKAVSEDHYNTLSAALLIRALDLYGVHQGSQPDAIRLSTRERDNPPLMLEQSGRPPRAAIPLGMTEIEFSQQAGAGRGFYSLTEAGFDQQVPDAASFKGLEVFREYLDEAGQPIDHIGVGEEFQVRLRVRATARDSLAQVAIVDLLPGGVEVVRRAPSGPGDAGGAADAASGQTGSDGAAYSEDEGDAAQSAAAAAWQPGFGDADPQGWQPDFAEIREDRIVLYGTVTRDVGTFVYRLRATNPGSFRTPPPYAESLYDRQQYGRGASGAAFRIDAAPGAAAAQATP